MKRKWKIEKNNKEEVQFQTLQKALTQRVFEEKRLKFPPKTKKDIHLAAYFISQNIVTSRSEYWIIYFIIWLAKFKPSNQKGYLSEKNNFEPSKYNVKIKMGKDSHMQMIWMLILSCLQEIKIIIIAHFCPIYGDPDAKPIFYP